MLKLLKKAFKQQQQQKIESSNAFICNAIKHVYHGTTYKTQAKQIPLCYSSTFITVADVPWVSATNKTATAFLSAVNLQGHKII